MGICVFGCNEKDVYLHRFPHPEKRSDHFIIWMSTLKNKIEGIDPIKIYNTKRICDYHFKPEDKTFGHRLSKIAVPTLHLEGIFQSEVTEIENEHNYCLPRMRGFRASSSVNSPLHSNIEHQELASNLDEKNDDDATSINIKNEKLQELASTGDENSDDDATSTNINNEKPEQPTPPIFSWQKEEVLYPTDDTDALLSEKVSSEEIKVEADESLYEEGPFVGKELNHSNLFGTHTGYQCNVCLQDIVGFRYTCVQCPDWDLCGACEARAAHAAHYVLRVPSLRPYKEIQAVLAVIRQQLLSENLFFTETNCDESLKEELGDEATTAPAAEPDPLQRRLSDMEDDIVRSNSSEHDSPKHKKRRLQADKDEISNSQDDVEATSFSPIKLTSPRKVNLKPEKSAPAVYTRPTDDPGSDHKDLMEISIDNTKLFYSIYKQKEATDETIALTDKSDNRTIRKPVVFTPIKLINPVTRMVDSAVATNLKDDSEASNLQVPPDTDDAALSQALHSKAYVRMRPLRVKVHQLICTKK